MKYLKLFKTHSEYEEAKSGSTLPNVSHCIEEVELHYTKVLDWKIRAVFNVSDISRPTKIGGYITLTGIIPKGLRDVEKLYIDGVEVEIPEYTQYVGHLYQFTSTGEHHVDYVMKQYKVEQSYDYENDISIENRVPITSTSVSYGMFNGCEDLTSVEIPNSITEIKNNAFEHCSSLTSIIIPKTVETIGYQSFIYCTNLTSVTVEATTPPTLSTFVFNNTNNCPIYVPSGSVNAYKAAQNWSSYSSRIQAIS